MIDIALKDHAHAHAADASQKIVPFFIRANITDSNGIIYCFRARPILQNHHRSLARSSIRTDDPCMAPLYQFCYGLE